MSVRLPNNVIKTAAGTFHTIFLLSDGTVYGCDNGNGQLGLGGTSIVNVPVKLNISNVKDIACGAYHTMFLLI